MSPIRIAIADDHEMIRRGVRALLSSCSDMIVVGEADNARDAVDVAHQSKPNVMLVDLDMPGGGLSAIERLSACDAGPRVLAFTMHDDAAHLRAVLDVGGHGYVVKTANAETLQRAIRTVHAGRLYADVAIGGEHPAAVTESPAVGAVPLSKREKEVLTLLARGYTQREVAEHLEISARTVETYRNRITEKLDLKSRVDLVQYALRTGLLSESDSSPNDD